jgi:hypothetical protein
VVWVEIVLPRGARLPRAIRQRRLVVGDPNVNTNWVFFGKPVLAVADGRVVAAVDRYPDQIPNNPGPVTLESADGNHVILRLGGGATSATRT